jgi:hypothetical protein
MPWSLGRITQIIPTPPNMGTREQKWVCQIQRIAKVQRTENR